MFQINWKLKALLYKVFETFKLNKTLYFVQRHITGRAKIQFTKLDPHWERHAKSIQEKNCNTILEVGAGKSLEQNIYLSYKSNSKFDQTLIDVSSMIDLNLFNKASEQISKLLNVTRKPFVKSIEDIKKFYNITYFAPCNIDEITKKNIIFDACISSASLEHFPKNALDNTFAALKKTIKKNGIISVAIDYSDHYSHTDNSIGHLNFLQFSDSVWEKYNTPFLFQNRFRHQNYRELFSKLGYEIVSEVKGKPGIPPKFIDDKFDSANKETYLLWGLFLLKIK